MYKKASTEPRMSRRQSYITSFRIEECEPELLIEGLRDTMKKLQSGKITSKDGI